MDDITNNHRLFLQKYKNIDYEQTIAKPPVDSVKLLAVSNLFKDADAEQLIKLRKYISYELYNRGTNVKVALCFYRDRLRCDGTSSVSSVIFEEMLRLVVADFLSINYVKLKDSTYLLNTLYGILMANLSALGKISTRYNSKLPVDIDKLQTQCQLTLDELLTIYDQLMSVYNEIEEYYYNVTENLEGCYDMINMGFKDNYSISHLEPNKAQKYLKYFYPDFTNPYLISVIEKLHSKGIKTHSLITTIHVPANKKMKQCRDKVFGDYVQLVDL